MHECLKPVTIQYAWASQIRKACLEHANQVAILGNAIGSPIQAQVIVSDELCQHMVEDEPVRNEGK